MDDPEAFLMAHAQQLVILDEVQRMPELFGILRGVIDQRRRMGQGSGQFLLLGSATGVLMQQSSESLAGRVAYVELPPLQASEILMEQPSIADLNALWVRGGFPMSWLAKTDADSMTWREVFISTYLEKDSTASFQGGIVVVS
jgi:predicted AAA+ superfamily ATPase